VTYRDTILADLPTHYWEFPPGGGQLFEDLGSSPTPMKQVAGAVPGYAGVWDGGLAASFNGSSRYQSDDLVVNAAPCSLEVWVWLYSWNAATNSMLDWDGATAAQTFLAVSPARTARFQAGGVDVFSPAALSLHAWHHIVGTFSGGVPTLYVDGASVAAGAGATALGAARSWWLGNDAGGGSPLNGLLASPAVYGAALTAAKVSAHFAAASDRTLFPAFIGSTAVVGAPSLPSSSVSTALGGLSRNWQNAP